MTGLAVMVAAATERALKSGRSNCHGATLQEQLFAVDSLEVWDSEDAALAIIEHMGVTFGTDDAETAVNALGMVIVYASTLAHIHSLAIEPIIELARTMIGECAGHAAGATELARVTRKPDAIPVDTVRALAMCIAKAMDDVEMIFELAIDPMVTFAATGQRIVDAAPKPSQPDLIQSLRDIKPADPSEFQRTYPVIARDDKSMQVGGGFIELFEREVEAAIADGDAKQQALDDHGYARRDVDDTKPMRMVGLEPDDEDDA